MEKLKQSLLEKIRAALRTGRGHELKQISNSSIEKAALAEDKDLVNISIISYALYKFLSKRHVRKNKDWPTFANNVANDLREAESLTGAALKSILERDIIEDITELDASYSNYARNVIDAARVKQASRIYALGMTIDKAIALTGADRFQLARYIGGTRIHDRPFSSTKKVADRYKHLKEVLK